MENKEGNKSNNFYESEAKDFDEQNMGLDEGKRDKKIYELNEKMKRYKNDARIFKEKAHKALAELNKNYLEKTQKKVPYLIN